MKRILLALLLLYCIASDSSFACMKSKEAIEDSWKLAATKQSFSSVGRVIMYKDTDISLSSGILIDPQTVLCDSHTMCDSLTILDFSNPEAYFSLSPVSEQSYDLDAKSNYKKLVKNLDGTSSSQVVKIISHQDYKHIYNPYEAPLNNEDEFKSTLEFSYSRHMFMCKVDQALSKKCLDPEGKIISLRKGPDLCILKLKDPITPPMAF